MPRAVLVYLLVLPLAALLGYMMATPAESSSFGFLLLVAGVLLSPVLLRHHHFLLTLTWNAGLIVFFLPGQPSVGMTAAALSLTMAIIERTMRRNKQFVWVPAVTWPLIMLSVVVIVTAKLTTGIGGRIFGSETWGAKRYFGVFTGLLGYFALTSQSVPKHKAVLYTAVFFLAGVTSMVSDIAYLAGPQFYWLFILFPSDYAALQAVTAETLGRLGGVAFACAAAYYALLACYGIRGVFSVRRPWATVLMLALLGGSLLGGYRGLLILLVLVFIAQFLVEGVYRTKLGPILVFGALLMTGVTYAYIDHMPLAVQRVFSLLPSSKIDIAARIDARGTLDWRLSMWNILLPEIPKYLILGKGYGFNGTDYYLTQEAVRRGIYNSYEDTLVSGNYHNGILTILIPFGIFGFGAFLWFAGAGLWVLLQNFRYGDPDLKRINTFLFAYFSARLVFYLVFYGQFDMDLLHFTGAVGLSIALNNGVRRSTSLAEEVAETEAVPAPLLGGVGAPVMSRS